MMSKETLNKRILVVEDSPTQALRAKLVLEEAGYQVDIASNGEEGLKKSLESTPDLVVADINMPVMDGNEMTQRLRADPRTSTVAILMLTANDQPLDVIRGLEVGADHFITKPYTDESLVWQVNSLFRMLEQASSGQLPEQQHLELFSNNIVVTTTRQQILQSLLQTTSRIINCQAMAILLDSPDSESAFYPISFAPLDDHLLQRLGDNQARILGRVRGDADLPAPARVIPVVVEEKRFSYEYSGDLLASFMNAPLMVDRKVVGIISVFSEVPECFDLQKVGFLFDLGQKAAEALSRLKAE